MFYVWLLSYVVLVAICATIIIIVTILTINFELLINQLIGSLPYIIAIATIWYSVIHNIEIWCHQLITTRP